VYSLFPRALRALHLNPRVFVHFPEHVQRPEAGFGKVTWVLARALCHFKLVDLSQVPARARAQALSLQVAQFSPYPATGHHAVWRDGRALVWYWDQAIVQSSMAEAGLAPQRVRVLPESVLYAPGTAGLRLIRNLQGVEGQCWQNDRLVQSRWWKEIPGAAEWLAFQRDIGLTGESRQPDVPAPQKLDLQHAPQLSSSAGAEAAGWRDERALYALLALALFTPTTWIGAKLIKSELAQRAVLASTVELERKALPQLDAREQALRAAARLQALSALDRYPSQLELMARVASALPKGAASLKEWDFRDGKLKIVLVVQSAAFSSSTLVGALQKAGGFENVQVAPGNDPKVLAINMDVTALLHPTVPTPHA
jgi:hypothetical protein